MYLHRDTLIAPRLDIRRGVSVSAWLVFRHRATWANFAMNFGWPPPASVAPHLAPAGCRVIPAQEVGGRLEENAPAVGQLRDAQAITERLWEIV